MKTKGFTLIELLATIAIIGILGSIAVFSVNRIIGNSEKSTDKMVEKNLADAATTYGVSKLFLKPCQTTFDPTNVDSLNLNIDCYKAVTVEFLIEEGYFEDSSNLCDGEAQVIIYNHVKSAEAKGEYTAYVVPGTCAS